LKPATSSSCSPDGIEEALSPDGELFGSQRALDVVREYRAKSAQQIVDQMYQAVRTFSGSTAQNDDITAVAIKVL
jgi:sigma-B regulation protein RsbU (phosphoserine phosphatase)